MNGSSSRMLDDERRLDQFESAWLTFLRDDHAPVPDLAEFIDADLRQSQDASGEMDPSLVADRAASGGSGSDVTSTGRMAVSPDATASANVSLGLELIRLDMEYRFKSDRVADKPIEAYRDEFPMIPCTTEWIEDEWRLRMARGESVDVDAWRERFGASDFATEAEFQRFQKTAWTISASYDTDDDDEGLIGQSTRVSVGDDTSGSGVPKDLSDLASIDTWASLRGRFEQKRMLGQGSFGTVWQAFDSQLQRNVAIKTLRANLIGDQTQRSNLIREARAAAALDHPNLMTIHDIVTDETQVHLVMQWVDGISLEKWFDRVMRHREPAAYVQLAQMMSQIAAAVHHAHLAGLIHCDLKPQNILVDAKGEPTVLDFGLAVRRSDQSSLGGNIVGTPAYMSPEQTFGETHHLDGRADIWALGVILYRLMTGELPFAASGVQQIFEAIQTRSLTPLGQHRDDVPPKLAEITTRCLTKRIEDRFATAGELADHLSRFAEQRTSITRLIAPTGKVAGLPWTQPDLIGRDDIIEDITQAWITEHPRSRLVTLTGGGGVGKTQTAAAIARRIAGVGEQDVIWIELAHATNVDQLDAAVAAALGVAVNDPAGGNDDSQSKDRGDRVLDTIAVGRPMVLVLDNVEQIISETAAAVSRWLGRSETLRVLVTSQTPLRIGGEQVRQLPPLSYAMRRTESSLFRDIYAEDMEWSSHESMATENGANDASSGGEALTLLMRRARAVRPDFEINDDNREDALEICRLVDGNPLAIELAAARLAVMNLPELRERIRQSFEVLKTNRVDRPERHKTLHDVVAWSFECLDADQSSAFLALSMWPAPMPSRIAEGLLDHLKLSGLDMLEDLAARNLIHVRNTGSLMRVQTTAAIQRFAENKLAPAQRNVFATALIACLSGPLKSTVEELPGDQRHHLASNLFAASDAIESTPSTAATRLSAVLMADRLAGDHWDATIRQQRLTPMLSLAQGITQLQLGLRLADAQRLSGKTDAAITMCDRIAQKIGALTESDDAVDELTVAVGRLRARIQYRRGQMAGAIASLEAVLPKSDEAITDPDPFAPPVPERLLVERIDALLELVEIQRRAGHLAVARSQLRRAKAWIAAHPVLEERTLRCQIQSGKISLQTGNLAEARQTFDAAVKSVTTKTDPRDLQQALLGRAAAHAEWGDFEAAERDYDRCEKISRRLGDLPTLAQALNNRALSQDDAGQSAAACETLERALEIYHRLQDSVGIAIASAAKAAALLQLNRCDETIAILESPEIRDSIAPDSIHRAMMAGDLGAAKHRVGELKDAKKWLCDSLQHLDQLGVGLTAERLLVAIELASVLGELKDPAAAAAHQRAAKLVSDWPRQRRDRGRVAAAIEAFETMLP